jgi:hypothetical protein
MTLYKAAYVRTPPQRLVTGVGYELCIMHRDAVMQTISFGRGFCTCGVGGPASPVYRSGTNRCQQPTPEEVGLWVTHCKPG